MQQVAAERALGKAMEIEQTRSSLEVIGRIIAERRTLEKLIIPVSSLIIELREKVNVKIMEITYIILEIQDKQTIIPKSPKIS